MDSAEEMLRQTEPHPQIHYLRADAQALPFADAVFGLAMHWFDQSRFLTEVRRVLIPSGWLVIYNSAFKGEMPEEETFQKWMKEAYLKRYPTPSRKSAAEMGKSLDESGFQLLFEEPFTVEVQWSPAQFTGYLITQSNIIAAVEQGTETLEKITEWITRHSEQFFTDEALRTFSFVGTICILRGRN